MNKRILGAFLCVLTILLCLSPLAVSGGVAMAAEDEYVFVGGIPIGISVNAGGLIVSDVGEVITDKGSVVPLANTVERGDVIYELNYEPISSIYQLKTVIEQSRGKVVLSVKKKNGTLQTYDVLPARDKLTDTLKIGLIAREDVGGIGTLTFVTEDGRFGALGHKISDFDNGTQGLQSGNIYPTVVSGVVKGENGKAGGLTAELNRLQTPLGTIERNTNIGIYGQYDREADGARLRIAQKGEARMGRAQVLTTVRGSEPRLYDVDVVKVVSQESVAEKGLVISVRDKELLSAAGGIVQGMSGSPIIQNGMLIGAITHVFLSDPTRGYGVHSRFMYDYAQTGLRRAA